MPFNKAIAMLDSGVGGLTVVREIFRQLPGERIVYFGDTARMPYGPRPHEEVRRFTSEIMEFLCTQDIKMMIVACNSASAAGLPRYQGIYDIPVLGVIEPGVRAALQLTRNRKVGVIGTAGTILSRAYEEAIKAADPGVEVVSKACPLFVLIVENNLVDTPEACRVAEEYLNPLKEAGVDTLILGCTHYPLMEGVIGRVMGEGVRLVSSAEETARETREILKSLQLLNPDTGREETCPTGHRFYSSGPPGSFEEIGEKLLNQKIKAYRVLF
jgi:glutamate racemase